MDLENLYQLLVNIYYIMIDAASVFFDTSINFFINFGGKVIFFELCVQDGQSPVRQTVLSGDSFCCVYSP